MDKYYKDEIIEESRTQRNQEKYAKMREEDIENLNMTSNISVIDADTTNLDINKLKEMLNEKYSKKVEEDIDLEETSTEEDLEDTKEYDLNKILEKAHQNKTSDYDSDRFKKLRDTQYDILSSLNLNRTDDPEFEESLTVEEANLMNLIKTLNYNAVKQSNDLMDDLLADDEPAKEPKKKVKDYTGPKPTIVEELEKTKQLSKEELVEEPKEEITEETQVKDIDETIGEEPSAKLVEDETDFYTGQYQIEESDLDDFSDLQKEMKSGNVFIKILVTVIILIIVATVIYFANKYFNLGLF